MKIELIGWGAEKHHNMQGPAFTTKKLKSPEVKVKGKVYKVNTCNRCGKQIPSRKRYCPKCKKLQQNEAQKRWRQKNG